MTEYHAYAILVVIIVAGALHFGYFCGQQVGRREAWEDAWRAGFDEAERQERSRQEREARRLMEWQQKIQKEGSYLDDDSRTWVPREPRRPRPNWIRRVK